MSVAPVLRAASGGITRRLVQTTVVFVVLAGSTAAALLGVTLLTSANELFYSAVAAQHGADLAVTIDAARVTTAQLAATRHAAGVTQAAGPYPETSVTLAAGPASGDGSGLSVPGLSVVGRAARSGPLDELTLNQGQWATLPGEIDLAVYQPLHVPIGSTVTVTSAPGQPKLTVVGYAGSVVRDEDAWMVPGQLAALRPRAAPRSVQMLYTFSSAGTGPQIVADLAAVRHVLPAGAVTGSVSWLPSARQTGAEQSVNTAFVVAFALIGLALAGLIVTNVMSGAVLAGYRRIGVLKSIGFTPAQVAACYVAQLGIPTVAGCLAGAALGNYWVLPELNNSATAFHVAHQTVPLWINVTVPLGMCLLAGLAALGVLNSVLLATRERLHDLGVFQAVGMTPRQTLAMVTCWVVVPAIGAAAIALPGGMLLQDVTVRSLARDIGLPLPGAFIHVYGAAELLLLALAGLGIAAAGALLPAGWAAAARTAAALRAE